jgi:hypothetical protein
MSARVWLPLVFLTLAVGGCSKRVVVPSIDPRGLAEKALAEYDLDRNGSLDAKELEGCPGLKAALARLDKDRDGRLSRAELEEYFQTYIDSKTGLQQVVCRFTLDDVALSGAEVLLEPEKFMGAVCKTAKGVTDERGEARFQVEGAPQPGCNLGVYRVRVTKSGAGGKQALPSRYNATTQLGLEVSPSVRGRAVFHLRSGS